MIIEQANKSQLNHILTISNYAFGNNFITKDTFEKYLNNKNKFLVVCTINNQIAGFITSKILNVKEFNNSLLQKIKLPNTTKPIGWVEQVAVHPNFYRKGIANKMLFATINHLNKFCNNIYCLSWVKGDVTPMSQLLIKNNFNLHHTLHNYWSNDSLLNQYSCVICGTPPCKCSAELYFLSKK